jgi:hypothetical protein
MNSKKLSHINPVKLAYKHNKTVLRGLATGGAAIAMAFTIPIGQEYRQKQSFLEAIHLEIKESLDFNKKEYEKELVLLGREAELPQKEPVREANRRKTDSKDTKRNNNSYKIHTKVTKFDGQENNLVFYRGEKVEKEVDNPEYLANLNATIN